MQSMQDFCNCIYICFVLNLYQTDQTHIQFCICQAQYVLLHYGKQLKD